MAENMVTDYELGEPVGESEIFTLYKAQHLRMVGRFRAVKMPQMGSEKFSCTLKPESLKTTFLKMCETAVQVAQSCDAAVGAEGIAARYIAAIDTVHFNPDAELDSNRPYILSEWIPGGSLAERLAQGPLPADQSVQIASSVLEALDFLHARNIVHGNLKPGNILLAPDGTPRLTDAGGNVLSEGAPLRLHAAPYLSPEQMASRQEGSLPLDGRTDLFSLTLILYEMLTGKRAERRESASRLDQWLCGRGQEREADSRQSGCPVGIRNAT